MTAYQKFSQDYQDKQVLILGLGLQGRGVGDAKIFAEIGAKVTVTDLKTAAELSQPLAELAEFEIKFTLGEHKQSDVDTADVVIRNASVPWRAEILEYARSRQVPITTDEALFFKYAQPKQTVGVTGTRGKSTTTKLIHQIMLDHDLPVVLAGNISPRPSLDLLKDFDDKSWYLFELSSWQLQGLDQEQISPHIAVITNIYPDHLLDRSYAEYIEDKSAIFHHQSETDFLILNADNQITAKLKSTASSQVKMFSWEDVAKVKSLLPGKHNLENIAAARQVAAILGIDQIDTSVAKFSSLPYRLEKVAEINQVDIYNDTTSTTPTATIKAVETFPDSVVIVGGTTKKLPTEDLITCLNQQAKKIILLSGTGTDEVKTDLKSDLVTGEFTDLGQAVEAALKQADPGDKILFSPGFTSFGSFKNEFDRGEQFNQIIQNYSIET